MQQVSHLLRTHLEALSAAYLRRRKMLAVGADDNHEMTPLAASAVAGTSPPAGPEWRRGTLPVTHQAIKRGRPLCVALDGFTLHAATRTGAMDDAGREALLEYILRPSVAQERVTRGPDGLVPIALKKAFADGTVAVDLDPLSLLSRLAASVPRSWPRLSLDRQWRQSRHEMSSAQYTEFRPHPSQRSQAPAFRSVESRRSRFDFPTLFGRSSCSTPVSGRPH